MHKSAERLFEVGRAKGCATGAEIARALGATDQDIWNWKQRGVPARFAVVAAHLWDFDPAFVFPDLLERARRPTFLSAATVDDGVGLQVAERRRDYGLPHEENTLLEGFRLAKPGERRILLLIAVDILHRDGRRSTNSDGHLC